MNLNSAIGTAGPVDAYLTKLLNDISPNIEGVLADYIPELAKSDPSDFAISIATVDGALYSAGRSDHAFTIQSVSKPFTFAYALENAGIDAVSRRVGVEPTGDFFNSIVLDEENNRPFNPMVNAGAIAMSEFVRGDTRTDRSAELLGFFGRMAGRTLDIDEAVFESERRTGHRNRAIAYMMLNTGMIEAEPEDILDAYFRQCSILVSCRDLAVMAATLAAHGRNPRSGEQVLSPPTVRDVLSVMATCGMYDYAGQWMFDVGLPAKSGVSGGLIAVLPGQLGVAVYSPLLDSVGNSVRGVEVCKRLSRDFDLHAYVDRSDMRNVVRNSYRGDAVHSNRVRSRRELDVLISSGSEIAIVEAQGALHFGSTERLVRKIIEFAVGARVAIVDMRRVTAVDRASTTLLRDLAKDLSNKGCRVDFTDVVGNQNLAGIEDAFDEEIQEGYCRFIPDIDRALESAEDEILNAKEGARPDERLGLSDLELFAGLEQDDISTLETAVSTYAFTAGETVLRIGDRAKLTFVVARGSVGIYIGASEEQLRRVASIGPGQSFGEMALLDGGERSADARADTDVLAYGIAVEELRRLSEQRPHLMTVILGNIVRSISMRLRNANDHIRALQ